MARTSADVRPTTVAQRSPLLMAATEQTRVLVVAGIAVGIVVVGVGSRVAMLVLRLTSPDSVEGVTSDDGAVVGSMLLHSDGVDFTLLEPASLVVTAALAVIVTACVAAQQNPRVGAIRATRMYGLAVRVVWSSVAIIGLVAVIGDIRDIRDIRV